MHFSGCCWAGELGDLIPVRLVQETLANGLTYARQLASNYFGNYANCSNGAALNQWQLSFKHVPFSGMAGS